MNGNIFLGTDTASTTIMYQSVTHILKMVGGRIEHLFPLRQATEYSYRDLELFVYSLTTQLKFIEEKHYTLYALQPQYCYEIIVNPDDLQSTNKTFVYSLLTPEELLAISNRLSESEASLTHATELSSDLCNEYMGIFDKGGYVTRYFPLAEKNKWMDPSIYSVTRLPFVYHYKTLYYSLSAILVELMSEETYYKIQGTRLLQFIKHCRINPSSKRIIFL